MESLEGQKKPQQRLYIAFYHLLLKCQHQLTLASCSSKYLRWLDQMMAKMLHQSVDGRGLANTSWVPKQHQWVNPAGGSSRGNPYATSLYISMVEIRGNLIGTALIRSRSNTCGKVEALRYISQVCPRPHDRRPCRVRNNKERVFG